MRLENDADALNRGARHLGAMAQPSYRGRNEKDARMVTARLTREQRPSAGGAVARPLGRALQCYEALPNGRATAPSRTARETPHCRLHRELEIQ